jgi:hypothetical protein
MLEMPDRNTLSELMANSRSFRVGKKCIIVAKVRRALVTYGSVNQLKVKG